MERACLCIKSEIRFRISKAKMVAVLKENPNLKKYEYKKIWKGLYSWFYKNNNEWFERVTSKYIK